MPCRETLFCRVLWFFRLRLFLHRAECYKSIIDLLDELLTVAQSHPQAPSVPAQPGPPKKTPSSSDSSESLGPLTPEEAQRQVGGDCEKIVGTFEPNVFRFFFLVSKSLQHEIPLLGALSLSSSASARKRR